MATSVFGVQALEPFEEASSPPVSPQSNHNPYETSLQRYRSGSSLGSQNQPGSPTRSPSSKKNASGSGRGFSLRRKKSGKNDVNAEGDEGVVGEVGLMRTLSERMNDNGTGQDGNDTLGMEERPGLVLAPTDELEEESNPQQQQQLQGEIVPPPAWKRRKSQLVKEEERRARETLLMATAGGLPAVPQGKGVDQEGRLEEMDMDLRPPTAAFAKGANGAGGGGGNGSASESGGEGWSPRSSTSSLRSFDPVVNAGGVGGGGGVSGSITPTPPTMHSRRSSAYGAAPQMASPLSKTAQEHEHTRHLRKASQVGGFEGMVPDMSNPTTPSGERPLDTIRRMSMLSDGRGDGYSPVGAPKRRTRGAVPAASSGAAGIRKKTGGEVGPVGIPMDDSIWPSMPSESPVTMPRPTKSRSVVSLASLNPVTNSKHKSMSTPPSPIAQRKTMSRSSSRSNSSTGTAGPNYPPGLTMTAANRQQYIQTMQRDYSMRLGGLGRDGGYAIAATMNAPPSISGLSGLGGSVGDFGSMRYSGDWSGSGFYDEANSSRPSLPTGFHSNSTSSTSLSLPPQIVDLYPASSTTSSSTGGGYPPSSYPAGMPTTMSPSSNQLQKTPSPLSRTLSREDSAQAVPLADSAEATHAGAAVESSGMATPTKSKKELAKEAKEAKARADRDAREKAATAAKQRAEAEKQKKAQAKLDKERAKAEKKAKKTIPAKSKVEQVKTSSMPATPLKGKTQALAATPSTVPSTPVRAGTPAGGPEPLLDMGTVNPEARGASGLGQSTVSAADLAASTPAAQEQTPSTPVVLREQPAAASPRPSAPARNASITTPKTLKPKRSFWNTMRQVFTGSPTATKQASTPKSLAAERSPAPDKGPLPTIAVLSPNKTGSLTDSNATPSEYPSTETPVESAPSTVAEEAYANLRAQSPPPASVDNANDRRPETPTQQGSSASAQQSPVSLRTYDNNKRNSMLDRVRSNDTFQAAQDTQLPISRQTSAASHHYSPPPSLGQVV